MTKSRLETPDWSESDNCKLCNRYLIFVIYRDIEFEIVKQMKKEEK